MDVVAQVSEDFPLHCSGHTPVRRVYEAPEGRRGMPPKPPGSYEFFKASIEEAVRTNAPPSLKLIDHNASLAWWEAYLGIGKVSSFPPNLFLAITDVCNARCLFCSYDPTELSNKILRVSDIERADWLKFVKFFNPNCANAEPLAHPQAAELFAAIRRQAPFIRMNMITNASLLTDKIANSILGHLDMMQVSLNAARKETYERDMALKWETTLANLKRLNERKQELGLDKPEVRVSIVVHRYNIDELPEMPTLLRSLGIDAMRVIVMNYPHRIKSRNLYDFEDMIYHDPKRANASFRQLKQECAIHGVQLVSPLPMLAEH